MGNFFTRSARMLFISGTLNHAAVAQAVSPPEGSSAAKITWDVQADTWVATDGLGRTLPTFEDVGGPKPDRTAAMFYYMWLDGRGDVAYDMAKRLERDPDARVRPGQWWWWGEPVLGYYLNTDPFVLRTHAQQLSDAGIDTLVFDSTNGYTHETEYLALCKTFSEIRALGQHTPQVAHVTNHEPLKTVQTLYDDFYAKNLYPELWFKWQGKPLIMTPPDKMTPQLTDFFTIRRSWAYHDPKGWFGDGRDRWPWLDNFPQQYGWHDDPKVPEQLSVSVAQHAHSLIGRNYTVKTKAPPIVARSDVSAGLYFDEQWSTVHRVNPSLVFITNYNEWIAKSYSDSPKRKFIGKPMQPGEGFFVDEYDPEFSRDIEPAMPTPANRGVDDNYYYQLVANLRRYKGVRPIEAVKPNPIKIDGAFDDWAAVAPEFRDSIGDPVHRDWPGFDKTTRYANNTGRNDIVAARVSYDAANVYFYVKTKDAITPRIEDDWMQLYLDTDARTKTGWLGYDFAITHSGIPTKTTTLSKNVGGKSTWQAVSTAIAYAVSGNEMELAIPRNLLGSGPLKAIDFKWADHCLHRGDWVDFTLNGDAAPNARFNYRAKLTGTK